MCRGISFGSLEQLYDVLGKGEGVMAMAQIGVIAI